MCGRKGINEYGIVPCAQHRSEIHTVLENTRGAWFGKAALRSHVAFASLLIVEK
jgi:hypothetical protein